MIGLVRNLIAAISPWNRPVIAPAPRRAGRPPIILPLGEIQSRLAAGETLKAVSLRYRCTPATIRKLALQNGVKFGLHRGVHPVLPPIEIMLARARGGDSYQSMAGDYGVTVQHIRRVLKRAGYQHPGVSLRKRAVAVGIPLDDLRRRLGDGETMRSIADTYGCHSSTISYIARRHDIPRNKSGPARKLPPSRVLVSRVIAGESLRAIGREFGVSGSAVGDAIKRDGWVHTPGSPKFRRAAS